jgi:hypothetical protein
MPRDFGGEIKKEIREITAYTKPADENVMHGQNLKIMLAIRPLPYGSGNVDHYLSDHGVLVFKPNGQWVVYFVLNEFKAIYCLEDRQVPLVNSPPPGSLAR